MFQVLDDGRPKQWLSSMFLNYRRPLWKLNSNFQYMSQNTNSQFFICIILNLSSIFIASFLLLHEKDGYVLEVM